MLQRRILLIAGLSLLAASVSVARPANDAEPGPGHLAERAEHHLDRMSEVLDLSEAQEQQVQVILDANREHRQVEDEELRQKRARLETLLTSDAPDAMEVGALVIDLHQRRAEVRQSRRQVRDEIEAVLTPEQREKMELMREMRSERGEHRKRLRHERGRMHRRHHDGLDSEEDH